MDPGFNRVLSPADRARLKALLGSEHRNIDPGFNGPADIGGGLRREGSAPNLTSEHGGGPVSIFAPQNVMGPAHRGNVIQQLAQGAAQNVMRRQKLKALIQQTAGHGAALGLGQPFRSSMNTRAIGFHGTVARPAAHGAPPGGPGPQGGPFADPGPMDLPSLPAPTDPTQAPSATAPPLQSGSYGQPGASGGFTWLDQSGQFHSDDMNAPNGIPLGNGVYYDPTTDTITGTPSGVHQPGAQF